MTAIHHRSQRIHGASPRELAESWGLPSNEDGMAASMPARLEPVLQYRAKMGREYQRRMVLSRELQATAGELRNIRQDVAETCRKVEQTVARLREQRGGGAPSPPDAAHKSQTPAQCPATPSPRTSARAGPRSRS